MDIISAVKPTAEIIDRINMIEADRKKIRAELVKNGVDLWVNDINKYLEAGNYDLRDGMMRIKVTDLDVSVTELHDTVANVVKVIFEEAGWDIDYFIQFGMGHFFSLSVSKPEPAPLSFWEFIRGKRR